MAALPAGTGLLADPWKMGKAGARVVPSEEPVAPEPVVLEPAALEPEPACPEWLSCVWPSQQEVGIMGIQVVPWVEMEKSGGVRPGGGATYPGIPPMEVLRVVTLEEEEVTPYPGVCSTIWLHDVGGAN